MRGFIIFVTGAAFGAAGTLMWLRKDFDEKLEEAKYQLNNVEKRIDENTEKVEKRSKRTQRTIDILNKKVKEYEAEIKKLQYGAVEGSQSGVEALVREDRDSGVSGDGEDDLPFTARPDGPKEGLVDTPYPISERDFIDDGKEDFDKVTLFYYTDDVLSEEDGAVIEDPGYLLGEDWKDSIGKFVPGEAFIRNEKRGTDYNVVCEEMRYSDEFRED